MFGSIRSVTVSAIAAFEYIQAQRAAPFSVREWVRSRASPGVLFIPYKAGQIAALRSMIATWMRLAIFEAMSQPEGRDQRLWFVVDELDALGAIDGLKDALARLRKFGGRCVLGFQSIAQVSSTYGQRRADPCRKLRKYAHSALLGQRKRRHVPIRIPADRRSRGPPAPGIPRQRSGVRFLTRGARRSRDISRTACHGTGRHAFGARAITGSLRLSEDRLVAGLAARGIRPGAILERVNHAVSESCHVARPRRLPPPIIPRANVRSQSYFVARTTVRCPHCGLTDALAGTGAAAVHETLRRGRSGRAAPPTPGTQVPCIAFLFYVETCPTESGSVCRPLPLPAGREPSDAEYYWTNHCEHCGPLRTITTVLRARRVHAGRASGAAPSSSYASRALRGGGGGLCDGTRVLRHDSELNAMAIYYLNMKTFGRSGGSSAECRRLPRRRTHSR